MKNKGSFSLCYMLFGMLTVLLITWGLYSLFKYYCLLIISLYINSINLYDRKYKGELVFVKEEIIRNTIIKNKTVFAPPKVVTTSVNETYLQSYSVSHDGIFRKHYSEDYSMMPSGKCHPKSISFYSSEWEKEFEQNRACAFSNYKEKVPSINGKAYKEPSPSYSSIHNYNRYGIHWAYLSNVCLFVPHKRIYLYYEHKRKFDRLEGYQHLWQFQAVKKPFPGNSNTSILYDDDGSWMIIPGWQQHTSHFTENIIMVNRRAANPSIMPPMRHVFLPQFRRKKEIKWTIGFLKGLEETHIPNSQNAIYFHTIEDILAIAKNKPFICFKHLGISGHVNHDGRGGYFMYPYEADQLRAAMYKAYDLNPSLIYHNRNKTLNLLYLPRSTKSKGRQLINVDEMTNLFDDMHNYYTWKSVKIHKMSMKDQIQVTMESDIIISVHGAAVATIVFLLPHSAYIELRPPNFRDNWYQLLCNQARLQHVAMNNFSFPLPPSCPSIRATLDPVKHQICWKQVHYSNFYVCIECLRSVLQNQFYEIRLLKYGY